MATPIEIVGLGEVLWDLLPGGRQLGGAPLNFAYHCHQLGHASAIVSRVGNDELGAAVRASLSQLGIGDDYVQTDPGRPTGAVDVTIDAQGQPSYRIAPEVAYDYLAWESNLDVMMRQTTAVCFGSLGQRN